MKPTEFVKVNGQFWAEHLKSVSEHLPVSHRAELPGPMLFPRMMVLTETPDWNILELVGVSREYRSLEVRRQKAQSIEEYFGVAEGTAVANLEGRNWFKDATIATDAGRRALDERFPSAVNMLGQEVVGSADQLLRFAPGNYSTFDRALLVHGTGDSIRVHWTFFALAIHRSEPADQYLSFLRTYSDSQPHLDPIGTLSLPVDAAALKADAFTSTYLAHGLQDATVDQFLDAHETILLSAFDATRLVRQPVLDGSDLQPDFILERSDGSHIVGDLKLPLLDPAEGKKRRRVLRDPVREGAAQLNQYAEYFATPEHRSSVQTKYDVDVANPRKLLIIPTQEPVPASDFATSAAEIVDYDTILRLHLATKA